MKKIYTTLLLLLVSKFCFAQFDRVNADPIDLSPGFIGTGGAPRLGVSNVFAKNDDRIESVEVLGTKLTYDVLSPKLKGGVGVSLSYLNYEVNHDYRGNINYYTPDGPLVILDSVTKFNSELVEGSIGYSPKLTFANAITWSPFINFNFGNILFNNLENHLKTSVSVGFLKNTKKSFYGIEYSRELGRIKFNTYTNIIEGIWGKKFNKNEKNVISSTLIIKLKYGFGDSSFNDAQYLDNTEYFYNDYKGIYSSFEYVFNVKNILLILSTRELGIGYKADKFGINFTRNGSVHTSYKLSTTIDLR